MATAFYQYRGTSIRETASGRPLTPGEIVELPDFSDEPGKDLEDKALVESGLLVYLSEEDVTALTESQSVETDDDNDDDQETTE